ncbi:MAG: choice-of-anchor B family protein [Crocinitomicaceae bacterium]|nr:choice-of-anchor B family protein [Crocinitomicaceae bacterium]
MKKIIFISGLMLSGVLYAQDQKNVVLLDTWTDTNIAIAVEGARYSDIWGFEMKGQNYCAVGSSEGVEILQVTDDELVFVDREPGAFQGFTVVHRDMKTYKNYLYVVGDEGTATLQIFDLSYLPDSISKVYDSNALFGICHNIFIDTLNAKLYACGANNSGMKVLDISNPEVPTLLADFTSLTYIHDCYVMNDTAFLNAGFDGLHIYDFSGPTPLQLGVLSFYPDQGYNHSGWVSPDKTTYCFTDETEGTKLKICNLSDLSLIQVNATFASSEYQNYTPHNVIIYNKLAFVAYYNLGLRIFDISSSPEKEIAYYDTFTDETAYKQNGAWGVYVFDNTDQIVVSDRQNGVFLFEFPIDLLESNNTGVITSNTPLIDENSYLIPRDHLDMDELTFSIADLKGSLVYKQQSFINWLHIPLTLSSGVYYFGIYDTDGELIESGKFSKAN